MFAVDPNLQTSILDAIASGKSAKQLSLRAGGVDPNDVDFSVVSNKKEHQGARPFGYVELNGYPMPVGDTCAIKFDAGDGRKYIYSESEWAAVVKKYNNISSAIVAAPTTSAFARVVQDEPAMSRDDMMTAFSTP